MDFKTDNSIPEGSILLYTFIILILMALLGAAIVGNTKKELNISKQTYVGRDAFTKADSTARIAILLSRAIFSEIAGDPADYLKVTTITPDWAPESTVEMKSDFTYNGLHSVRGIFSSDDIRNRHLAAVGADGTVPDVKVYSDGKLVGMASVSISLPPLPGSMPGGGVINSGGSLNEDRYNSTDDNKVQVFLVITSSGSVPQGKGGENYFTGDPKTTHSIVNTIYREFVK